MILFWEFRKKIPKRSQKPNLCQKWQKPYKYPIFFHISSKECYFLTLTFFLLVLTWNHPTVTTVTTFTTVTTIPSFTTVTTMSR